MARCSWLLLPDFLIATSTASSNIPCRSFHFFRAYDPRVCPSFGLLSALSDQILDSRMAHQEVKIAQDFHETVASSYGLCHNFLCKSNKHLLLTFQISSQMPPFDTTFWTVWGMFSMLITDQINLYLVFLYWLTPSSFMQMKRKSER